MFILIFIFSCTPINIPTQSEQSKNEETNIEKKVIFDDTENQDILNKQILEKKVLKPQEIELSKEIIVLFSNKGKEQINRQFINVLELAIYNKNLNEVSFTIKSFENKRELEAILESSKKKGRIFIGPIESENTEIVKGFCEEGVIFFSFSSNTNLANDCVYLLNFFPKNELQQLFLTLEDKSRVALLYPENNYGYKINSLIDSVVNSSKAVLVNRASYKQDLSNVRDAIKELGKYELRKYELERQKKILSNKNDNESKKRLKKLQRFKTTSDYEFTHVLLADYGINLLQVAPLLPYYDIDPKVVQFLSTGVIDDENFFYEPSLQGTIFPGTEKNKRIDLLKKYEQIYNEELLRISTLPYDLVGLLNYTYSRNLSYNQMITLLKNPSIKFDGVDGKFYFINNMIERDLDILKISDGVAYTLN